MTIGQQQFKNNDNGLFINGKIENISVSFLIDTGASVSIIRTDIYNKIPLEMRPSLEPINTNLLGADGKSIPCKGTGWFELTLCNQKIPHQIWVAEINLEGIIGLDFLNKQGCKLDLIERKLQLQELPNSPYDDDEEETCCHIVAEETTMIPPEAEMLVKGRLKNRPKTDIDGITEPTCRFLNTQELIVAKTLINTSSEEVTIRLLNPSQHPTQIHQGTAIARVELVEEIRQLNEPKQCNHISSNLTESNISAEPEIPPHLEDLWTKSITELDPNQQSKLRNLLWKHRDLFAKHKQDTGVTKLVQHKINTGDALPIKQAARRLPIHQRQAEKEQVQTMLQQGII